MIIGISHSPSPYKIRMAGTEYNLRCGADILLTGLQGDLEGESTCIVCGSKVQLKMQGTKLSQIEPGTAILHVVEIPRGPGTLQIDCEATPLFDKEECLQSWLRGYHGKAGTVYKLEEYVDHVTQGGKARVALRPQNQVKPPAREIRCADCDCSPSECRVSPSPADCPNCRLEQCCCWTGPSLV